MPRLDTVGTYRGDITEHSLGVTKKSGYPQFIVRVNALEKWIETPSDLEHFEMTEPGWVDWSSFGEDITGFLVLFNDADTFNEDSALLNYEQVQLATGWAGDDFEPLNNGEFVGQKILFRVEENTYENNTTLQLEWIDAYEASPTRELSKLDGDKVKDLSKKLSVKKSKKPAAAKPAAKPAAKKTEEKAPAKAPPKKKEEPVAEEVEETSNDLPTACSQGEAWEFVCDHKGGNSDSDVQDAWISAVTEVGGDKDEDNFTDEEWAKVRNIVVRDLSLDTTAA